MSKVDALGLGLPGILGMLNVVAKRAIQATLNINPETLKDLHKPFDPELALYVIYAAQKRTP